MTEREVEKGREMIDVTILNFKNLKLILTHLLTESTSPSSNLFSDSHFTFIKLREQLEQTQFKNFIVRIRFVT